MGNHCTLYLKVPALLINGDYEFVDVGDELVTLGFPQSVSTLLQKLHEDILGGGGQSVNKGRTALSDALDLCVFICPSIVMILKY